MIHHSCGSPYKMLDLKNIKVYYCPSCRIAIKWEIIG